MVKKKVSKPKAHKRAVAPEGDRKSEIKMATAEKKGAAAISKESPHAEMLKLKRK